MINDTLHDGTAMAKFTAMLKAQGVKPEVADRLCAKDTDVMEILPKAKYRTEMKNAYSGILSFTFTSLLVDIKGW